MNRGFYPRRWVSAIRYWSPAACRGVFFLFSMLLVCGLWGFVIQPLKMWSERIRGVARSEEAQAASASRAEDALREVQNKLLRVRNEFDATPSWSGQPLEDRVREMISRTLSRTGGELLSVELKSQAGKPSSLEVRAESDYDTMLDVLDAVRTTGMPLSVDRHVVSFESSALKHRELVFILSVELQPFSTPASRCLP